MQESCEIAIMSILKKNVRLSIEEYLQGEQYSDIRHEYEHGEVVAMVGASRKHDRLAVNAIYLGVDGQIAISRYGPSEGQKGRSLFRSQGPGIAFHIKRSAGGLTS
jgi:hypothetical protein